MNHFSVYKIVYLISTDTEGVAYVVGRSFAEAEAVWVEAGPSPIRIEEEIYDVIIGPSVYEGEDA